MAVSVVVGGAVAGYRTYDYIEHDNEFCLSCHLMVEPYELFARSAHRDLGCKACHKPTFAARSQMALTQIVENPDTLGAHAEVPNEKCAACHVEGDPNKWESVANSAGHRVHLESDDPSLEGLNCVECHSSSLHQFTAASETCAQSGCHVDSGVQLGGMSDLTIHCTACHGFSEPVPEGTPLEAAMAAVRPDANACLSCHAMRALVEMPPDEPHDAVCGSCHNPHEQTTPEQAVETCATAECHSQPAALSPMHRGLGVGVLADCSECHEAHDWRVPAEDCVGCHGEVLRDDVVGANGPRTAPDIPAPVAGASTRVSGLRSGMAAARRAGLVHPVVDPGAPASGPAPGVPLPESHPPLPVRDPPAAEAGAAGARGFAAPPSPQVADTTFSHRRHRSVDCTRCHSTDESHGRLTVTSLADCRSCHHRPPVVADCSTCHAGGSFPDGPFELTRDLELSVGLMQGRSLAFDHDEGHGELACGECHTSGLALSARSVDCSTCHEQHHRPEVDCTSCHRTAPTSTHDLDVHAGCAGSGCHEEVAPALAGIPPTRSFCEACHQDLVDHRIEGNCVECHRLPTPRGGAP